MITCVYCSERAVMAVRTGGRDSVRGINTTVYYEPEHSPRGAERFCREHGLSLLGSLVNVLSS